ncbi:MAG: fimbrial assembly protein [Rhodocyclales bacterium]|nr:fimbrial assembly protein [Rhodocyclales bacterium]
MATRYSACRGQLRRLAHALAAGLLLQGAPAQALNISQSPLFLTQSQPPLVLLTMARDHRLYYEAYNDTSDLNDDGVLDIGYKPAIDYYGYFDSYKCYAYSTGNGRFEPASVTANKKCSGAWSGDFLNYVTTSRMDALRKVLYGGKRSTDSTTETVLERAFIPQDAHAWGKEYESVARDGYDITEYTPLSLPSTGTRHLFANVTLTSESSAPLMRVLNDTAYRVWEWLSIERPVADTKCVNQSTNCAGGGSVITDYIVRVKVCDSTIGLETSCQGYGSPTPVYKPIGLVQTNGQNNGMFFGLITGSYAHNTDGGVLRRAMSSVNSEIMADGRFGTTSDTCANGATCVNGIISTLNKVMVKEFQYSSHAYDGADANCGWITSQQMTDGQCRMWGNPIAEMMYEGLRYFAGKSSATSEFTYSGSTVDSTLGLPQITTWTNPYSASPNTPGATGYSTAAADSFPSCSKPYMMVVSDVYPSFDSDKLPGSGFATFTGDLSGLNVSTLGATIWNGEFGSGTSKSIFIGEVGATADSAPTAKTASSFGNIRGLAPAEPTRQGSYYAASVAYHGHITDLNDITGSQKLNTYSVALAAPLPTISVPVDSYTVTIVPFAKSVGQDSTSWVSRAFLPTNQIVDFYVDTIRNVTGSPTDASVNGGRPYYKFRINYEDVEQGADHDMDAIAIYEIKLNADNTVSVAVTSEYAAGGIMQHMGYVISGTTRDGIYLVVRDMDTAGGSDFVYALDCRSTTTSPFDCVGASGSGDLPLAKELVFTASSSGSAVFLKDPLWYAAKWGSFADDNANNLPDGTEWDADSDGIPDNYFLVTNPLEMEQQLAKALSKIKADAGTAASLSTNSFSAQSDTKLFQARFSSDGWGGELNAYPINADGSLAAAAWQAQYEMASLTSATRVVLTYDKDQPTTKGIPFRWANMTSGGTLQTQLNKNAGGTTDSDGADRVTYLRGDTVAGMRTRPYIKGTTTTNKLGDVVSSQPQYVARPNFGYSGTAYSAFATAKESRTPMVYVGGNDGMLHGFNADTGDEKLAYVPSEMYRTRNSEVLSSKLTAANYGQTGNAHHFYVDGSPTIGDICTSSCSASGDWKTIVVGGFNGGGQGIYALDITNPSNFSEANAGSLVLWEFNDWQDTDSDADMRYALGYTYSRPAIVRVCTDRDNSSGATPKTCSTHQWAVIFGNGYNNTEADGYASTSGHAVLYILNAHTGAVLKKISTETGDGASPNGLATVAPIDVDEDGVVDYVYAGDLRGNMWKFDLTADNMSSWDSAYKSGSDPKPLYIAKDGSNNVQPITTAPEVIIHPNGGYLVLFGTGQYLAVGDNSVTQQQTVYGIWDNGAAVSSTNKTNLQQQTVLSGTATSDGTTFRTFSTSSVAWTGGDKKDGWYMNLPDSGERVAYEPRIFGSLLYFPSLVPATDMCSYGGYSWDNFVDALTGARLSFSPFDGLAQQNFGDVTGFAGGRKSKVGITPTGTIITQGKGRGTLYEGGSTGEVDKFKVSFGASLAGRLSWREILND